MCNYLLLYNALSQLFTPKHLRRDHVPTSVNSVKGNIEKNHQFLILPRKYKLGETDESE